MSAQNRGTEPSQDHGGFDELAVGWALHALEPEDETLFAQHLPGCARCADTVAETSEVMAAMATDLPQAEPSPELRERLSAAVAATEQVTGTPDDPAAPATGFPRYRPVGPGEPTRPAFRRRLPALALAAAMLAVVALGIWNVFLADTRDDLRATVAQQERIVKALLTPGEATVAALSADDGQPMATVVARTDRIDVISYGLPANDTDAETYVVWGIGDSGPEPLVTFDVTRSQMDLQTVGSDRTGLDGYPEYGISLEPGRQAPAVPTDIVAIG